MRTIELDEVLHLRIGEQIFSEPVHVHDLVPSGKRPQCLRGYKASKEVATIRNGSIKLARFHTGLKLKVGEKFYFENMPEEFMILLIAPEFETPDNDTFVVEAEFASVEPRRIEFLKPEIEAWYRDL